MTTYRDRHLAGEYEAEKPEAAPEVTNGTQQATQGAIDLAAEHGIDLNSITGSGLHGKITKPDVEAALEEAQD